MKLHLKRLAAHRNWPLARKAEVYFTKARPGAHGKATGFPLIYALRDVLHLGKTRKEVRDILRQGNVLVDQTKRADHRHVVGLMDVLSMPTGHYRIVLNEQGRLDVLAINEKEAKQKIVNVKGKSRIKGKTQLNLTDGRNIIVDKDTYNVGDGVVLALPEQKIVHHYPFEKKACILLIGGKHIGKIATVESIEGDTLVYQDGKDLFETKKKNAFVLGKDKPALPVR